MSLPPREDKPDDGNPMFNRITKAGASGVGASTIGLTLAFCIVGGALAGVALDKHFGTAYWTPILFLVGVAAGFIQMMRTLSDVNRLEEAEQKRAQAAKTGAMKVDSRASGETAQSVTMQSTVPSRPTRVPAPPTASFDAPAASLSTELPSDVQDDLVTLRRMLQEQRADDEGKGKS